MKRVFLLFLILYCSFSLLAQSVEEPVTGESPAEEEAADTAGDEGMKIGISAEVGGGVFLTMPEISIFVSVPMNFGVVGVQPGIGFYYVFTLFDITEYDMYFPLFIDTFFPKAGVGVSLKYSLALPEVAEAGMLSLSVKGLLPILDNIDHNVDFTYELGAAMLMEYGHDTFFLGFLHVGFSYTYIFQTD